MGIWARSWALTRASFGVIRQDREMFWFPILAGVFSALFSAALLVPTFVLQLFERTGHEGLVVGPLEAVVLFVTYFGLSFIATFFNVCVVYTTRVRLSGGDATFLESIKFALGRAHLIAGWSVVSATMGLLLRALDSAAQRAGLVGKIMLVILRALLATAWALSTVFVVPSMVYKGLGPVGAFRDSVATLRQTWGENLVRYYGLGLVAFVCSLPALALIIGGVALASAVPPIGVVLIAIGALGLLAVSVLFNMAGMVFKTALYHWATTRTAPSGFEPDMLSGAFGGRG